MFNAWLCVDAKSGRGRGRGQSQGDRTGKEPFVCSPSTAVREYRPPSSKLALNSVLLRPAQSIHIAFPKAELDVDKVGPECGKGQERARSPLVLAIYATLRKLPCPSQIRLLLLRKLYLERDPRSQVVFPEDWHRSLLALGNCV